MRDIKYQAWDGKRMFNVGHIDFDLDGTPRSIYDVNRKMDGLSYGYLTCKLREYTGLKDKNGVEIYEGDIVSIHDATTRPEPYIGQVKWDELATGFESFPKGQLWGMFLHDHPMLKAPLIPELKALVGDGSHRTIEVIGNIYENPELLEVNDGK